MKRVFTIAALLLAAACSHPAPSAIALGDLRATVAIDPDPAVAAENQLLITLTDSAGSPVDGATIGFRYDMAAMGSMAAMSGGGDVSPLGQGRYRIAYSLPMLGDWTLGLSVSAPGHAPSELTLRISPPHRGFRAEGAGGMVESGGGMPPMVETSGGFAAGKPLSIPPQRQQLIGVTFGKVEERPLSVELRAPGRVEVDERQLADVTIKYEAYVEQVIVGVTGAQVKAGDPLVSVYSPDLVPAEQELLQAKKAAIERAPGAEEMMRAARTRLKLWDFSDAQIEAVEASGSANGRLTIHSPASGAVLEKTAVAGMHLMPGMSLYRIGNLGHIWVIADIYEFDASFAEVGQRATMTLPALAGPPVPGRVTFVSPTLDPTTRTLQARLEFANAALKLKPGMYADVTIDAPLGTRLAVPERALLLSGEHRYSFLDRGNGRLQAVEVQVGVETADWAEVRAGLSDGDRVATNATFLLSSEAQLRDALPKWSAK